MWPTPSTIRGPEYEGLLCLARTASRRTFRLGSRQLIQVSGYRDSRTAPLWRSALPQLEFEQATLENMVQILSDFATRQKANLDFEASLSPQKGLKR